MSVISQGQLTISTAIRSLELLERSLDEDFIRAIDFMMKTSGRIVVTGMGKSGIIGKKIAATLASTGTPSMFIHPAEAVHGDLGMLTTKDLVLALSHSGETDEVITLLSSIRLMGIRLIAMVGKIDSTLGKHADVCLHIPTVDEGCPIGCAPMASTTTTLVLGDALAAALMNEKGFERKDFVRFHPKGTLGRRLTITVDDLMVTGDELPTITHEAPMGDVVRLLIHTNLGAIIIVNEVGQMVGIVTDGDMKRLLDRAGKSFFDIKVHECMTKDPKRVYSGALAESALHSMEKDPDRPVTVLPVVNESEDLIGLIRLHDIVAAKIR